MISPTGLGIRDDSEGDGRWGSERNGRIHKGSDYKCVKGQEIVAPIDMKIVRRAMPKTGYDLSGIAWKSANMEGKMFYFEPDTTEIGSQVHAGQFIGYAQSVSEEYDLPYMIDHIHFQIDSIDPEILRKITKYLQ